MNQAEVIARLQPVFDQVFLEQVVVTPLLSVSDVAEWDSLTQIALVIVTEKVFSVRFRSGEVEQMKNVGEFADLILKHLNQ
jgi:acyl carrier protein